MRADSAEAGLVSRESLSEQVARLLMRSIVERRLSPGDEVEGELQLATHYGVSRAVAREALRHLAALNMVQLANGKHPVVKPLSGELLGVYFRWAIELEEGTFVELHELRRAVEGACAYHAAERRTPEDVAELNALLERMRAERDRGAFAELDLDLHVAIARAAHNRLLLHTVESVRQALRDVIVTGMELMERQGGVEPAIPRLQRGHERIVKPIIDGNPDLARRRMDDHLRGAVANYVAAGHRAAEG